MRILRQNLRWFVLALFVGGVLGVAVKIACDRWYPLWSGSVVFELNPQISPDEVFATDQRLGETIVRLAQTETLRLTSEELLESAVTKPDILGTDWAKEFLDDANNLVVGKAVLDLQDSLRAGHRRDTQYFVLSWSAHNPEDVPVVLNTIARTYREDRNAANDERFAKEKTVYIARRDELNSQIRAIQNQINDFMRKNGITRIDELSADELTEQVTELAREIQERRTQLDMTSSQLNQTQAKMEGLLEPSEADVRQAESEPVVLGLIDRITSLRIELDAVIERLSADHPSARRLEQRLQSAEDAKDREVRSIIDRNLGALLRDLGDQQESLVANIERLDADFAEAETRLQERAAARKKINDDRTQQESLEEQLREVVSIINDIDAMQSRETAQLATIARRATKPREKSFPTWRVVVPASMVVVLGLTVGFVFLRELLDPHVKYPSDLVSMAGVRLLGVIPDLKDDPTGARTAELVVRNEPDSVIAESCRQVAAQVGKALRNAQAKSLLVMSGMPESGATTILSNLAGSAAAAGRRVVVVDANFRRPGLDDAMGVDGPRGLGDVLAGEAELDDVLVPCGDGVDLLSAGSEMNRVFERLDTDALGTTLERLKARYDLVLVDSPPGVVAGDAIVLANRTDATLLVVRADAEERGLVGRLVGQLKHMDGVFLGVVLNRPRHAAGGYFRKNYRAMAGYGSARS